jgi:hypothetical protein
MNQVANTTAQQGLLDKREGGPDWQRWGTYVSDRRRQCLGLLSG